MVLQRPRCYGFTLVELVIVLMVLGIIASVVSINWPSSTIALNTQVESLANDIRYAQNLAITKGERYLLVKTSPNSYQITNNKGIAVTMPSGNSTVTLGNRISFGKFINLPQDLIAFDGKGIPYVDAAIPGKVLKEIATISLIADGNTATVTIYPETGSVTI
jgi:prepilin-type N-terminal cleavage/methylation domain-containing protein